MIRIVVCGFNSLLLAGLIAILDSQSHLEIVGSFSDEIDLTFLNEKAVDLLLLEQTPKANWWQLEQWMLTTNRTSEIYLTPRETEILQLLGMKG